MQDTTRTRELTWLIDDFVDRVVGINRAAVLSNDGLLIGRSSDLSHEDAEHLSAMASAYQSLSRGTARQFDGGRVRQTLVEMDNAFLFVMAAGKGASIAVLAANTADLGMVAFEMNRLVKRVSNVLSAGPRSTAISGTDPGNKT